MLDCKEDELIRMVNRGPDDCSSNCRVASSLDYARTPRSSSAVRSGYPSKGHNLRV
jgi:hypothetical protein